MSLSYGGSFSNAEILFPSLETIKPRAAFCARKKSIPFMAISSVENRHCDSFDKIKEKFSKQSTFMGGGNIMVV